MRSSLFRAIVVLILVGIVVQWLTIFPIASVPFSTNSHSSAVAENFLATEQRKKEQKRAVTGPQSQTSFTEKNIKKEATIPAWQPTLEGEKEAEEAKKVYGGCCQVSPSDNKCAAYEYANGCVVMMSGQSIGCGRAFWNANSDYNPNTGMCEGPDVIALRKAVEVADSSWRKRYESLPQWVQDSFNIPPDTRPQQCLKAMFPSPATMPHVTVVIPYLNEQFTQIRATIASMIWSTDMDLIDEIRFVNDHSRPDHVFKEEIEALHPKIRVISNNRRLGLIHSKIVGARGVASDIIFFLEPHCIMNRNWLETILSHMMNSPKSTVVVPVIDLVSQDFHDYTPGAVLVGGFEWPNLLFNWDMGPQERNRSWQQWEPYPTSALSGGILAIWNSWWISSGTYDSEMTEWGAEHIEMSVRVWSCGGRIETVPCSRLGHWFRGHPPYSMSSTAETRNSKRLALVWADKYLEDFYAARPAARDLNAGDVSERILLKKKLKCKDIDWYFEHVYPESGPHPKGKISRLWRKH